MEEAAVTRDTLSFLDADLRAITKVNSPVNVFEIARFPRWETVASNVLAYFLDPGERHGFGTSVVDALLANLGSARLVREDGALVETAVDATEMMGSTEWSVQTEVVTEDLGRIDIYLSNDELNLAIVLENKIDAVVNNPFRSYVARAERDHARVLCVVLTPKLWRASERDSPWISGTLTYDQLFDEANDRLHDRRASAEPRSLALYDQFVENLSERQAAMDHAKDADALDAYFAAIEGREAEVASYFIALNKVNEILRVRGKSLASQIGNRLTERQQLKASWFLVAWDKAWARANGRVSVAYVAFELTDGNCIELMLGHHPAELWKGMAVKGYPNKRQPGVCYADFDHIEIGVTWRSSDEEVVGAFIEQVDRLVRLHPRNR